MKFVSGQMYLVVNTKTGLYFQRPNHEFGEFGPDCLMTRDTANFVMDVWKDQPLKFETIELKVK